MDTIHLYSISNWHLVRYLWPNGTLAGDTYTVWLDPDSPEYADKLSKLRKVNSAIADTVHTFSDYGAVMFTLHCDVDYPKPHWPYQRG